MSHEQSTAGRTEVGHFKRPHWGHFKMSTPKMPHSVTPGRSLHWCSHVRWRLEWQRARERQTHRSSNGSGERAGPLVAISDDTAFTSDGGSVYAFNEPADGWSGAPPVAATLALPTLA